MAIFAAIEFGDSQGSSRLIFSDFQSDLSAMEAPYDHRHSSHLILDIKALLYVYKVSKDKKNGSETYLDT